MCLKFDVGIGNFKGADTILLVWWKCAPLHEKAQKKTKKLPMETTACRNIPFKSKETKTDK